MKNYNMKKNVVSVFVILVFVAMFSGCSEGLPSDFPKTLTNFTIELLYEKKPVEGASVSLISEDTNKRYLVTGFTASNGITSLETLINKFSKPGVPAGQYKVIISHVPKTSIELTQHEVMTLSNDVLEKREEEINKERAKLPHPIPENWNNLQTTPIKITVPKIGGKITIEITDQKTYEQ
jgi:hypothetical protein